MRVIWSLGEARVDEVYNQISLMDWSLATVKTLLGRLVKKEMLSTEKEGRKFIYRPLIDENDAIDRMSQNLLKKVCATKQRNVLGQMIANSELTKSDIEQLQEALSEKVAVAEVHCNCLETVGACACKHEAEHMEKM